MAQEQKSTSTVPKPLCTPFNPVGLSIGCLFGGFFTALSLADFSAISFALQKELPIFAQSYVEWKSNAPVISTILLCLVAILPLEIFRALREDVWGAFKGIMGMTAKSHPEATASQVSNATRMLMMGALQFFCLMGILYYTLTKVLPQETLLRQSNPTIPEVQQLYRHYSVMLGLNIVMLILPFYKYNYSQKMLSRASTQSSNSKKQN